VTTILPRRSYSALLGRLLHDRTADKIAEVVSLIPRSAATIVPYDGRSRVRVLQERQAVKAAQDSGAAQETQPSSRGGPRPAGTAPFAMPSGDSTGPGRGQPGAVASGTAGEEISPIRR
jgi:hypothetical protein